MAPITSLEYLTNPLVTAEQLYSLQDDDRSRSQNGQSLRYAQALLTQAAGVLLRLPQEVVATSLVLLQRFWVEGHGQGHATADLKVQKRLSNLPESATDWTFADGFTGINIPLRKAILYPCIPSLRLQRLRLFTFYVLSFTLHQCYSSGSHVSSKPRLILCLGGFV